MASNAKETKAKRTHKKAKIAKKRIIKVQAKLRKIEKKGFLKVSSLA